MPAYDFIVMGAGIAGVSIGAELAAHATVAIVEREPTLAYHSTGRSAALFIETYGPPVIRLLTSASRDFLTQAPGTFAASPLTSPRGMLLLAGAGEEDQLSAIAGQFGEAGCLVTREECVSRVPILIGERLCGAYFEAGVLDLDVDALYQGFLRRARDRGATLIKGVSDPQVMRVDQRWSLRFGDDVLHASTIVNAAGAWADELALTMGASPKGLSALRRTAVLVDAPAGHAVGAWPAVMDIHEQFYFKPDAGRLLLSPADETLSSPGDVQAEELDIATAVDRVQQVADLPVRRVSRAWAGLRTFAPDGVPIVGYDPDIPGLFWLAGQGGYGIQTAPALAQCAASLALREGLPLRLSTPGIDVECLSPARAALRSPTSEKVGGG